MKLAHIFMRYRWRDGLSRGRDEALSVRRVPARLSPTDPAPVSDER